MKRFTKVAICCALGGCVTEKNVGFTSDPDPTGKASWAIRLGSATDVDMPVGVAIDSIGDVVVAAQTERTSLVTKRVASDGSERWSHVLGDGTGVTNVWGVAVAPDDSVVVVGTADTATREDLFVTKYASDGTLAWTRGTTATEASVGNAVAIDAAGLITVTGVVDGASYLLQLDPDGNTVWDQLLGGGGANCIATTSNGDIVIAGGLLSAASVGGAVLQPDARLRAYWSRFRADGLYLASGVFGEGDSKSSTATQVAIDASDRMVFQSIEDMDNLSDFAHGGVHVIDASGTEVWSATLTDNGNNSPQGRSLATAPDGRIITTAWDDAPYNADHRDLVTGAMELIAFDASGDSGVPQSVGSRDLGAPGATATRASAVGAHGAIAIAGTFAGMIELAGSTLATSPTNEDDQDIFVVLFDPPAP